MTAVTRLVVTALKLVTKEFYAKNTVRLIQKQDVSYVHVIVP